MSKKASLVPMERLERSILLIRKQKVMLDSDLADLYGVTTRRLNEQVRRNNKRFPLDFMFQLSKDEAEFLRSQNATSKSGRGGRRYMPYVFTEQGVAMLSSVLNSERAVDVNIEIMRAFVRLRKFLSTHEELARKLVALESKVDKRFQIVFEAIEQLLESPEEPKGKMGFRSKAKSKKKKTRAKKKHAKKK